MSFVEELRRRNVVRVGIAYLLAAWVALQGADFAFDLIGAPDWVIRALSVVVALGLPVALFVSWAFELTPDGLKRENEIDRSASITPQTGKKLDRLIILALVLVVAWFLFDEFYLEPREAPASQSANAESENPAPTLAKSIAVLPFANMSPDPDQEYFSDGISEEILNVLADIPELKVAARTSTFAFKNSQLGITEIADKLGVTHVLEGSVRRADNQVRVTAQLIQASDGFHLWSENYDRQLDNIFAIQDEIAASIAGVLEVHLLGEQVTYTRVQDLSPEVYERFLKARYLMRRRNDADLALAVDLNRQVVAEAPDFPEGLAQLGESLVVSSDLPQANAEVEALADRTLELNPDLAAGHMLKGQIAQDAGRLIETIIHLQKAIELDPSEPRPHHWLGITWQAAGYLDKARQELQAAVNLEPDHANANGYLGTVLMLQGELDLALQHFQEQARLGNELGLSRMVQIELVRGDSQRARSVLAGLTGLDSDERSHLELFCDVFDGVRERSAYLDVAGEHGWNWNAELGLLILGEYRFALQQMINNDTGGARLFWSHLWDAARAEPGFMAIMERSGAPLVWEKYGPPPMCRKIADKYDCGPVNESQ